MKNHPRNRNATLENIHQMPKGAVSEDERNAAAMRGAGAAGRQAGLRPRAAPEPRRGSAGSRERCARSDRCSRGRGARACGLRPRSRQPPSTQPGFARVRGAALCRRSLPHAVLTPAVRGCSHTTSSPARAGCPAMRFNSILTLTRVKSSVPQDCHPAPRPPFQMLVASSRCPGHPRLLSGEVPTATSSVQRMTH